MSLEHTKKFTQAKMYARNIRKVSGIYFKRKQEFIWKRKVFLLD